MGNINKHKSKGLNMKRPHKHALLIMQLAEKLQSDHEAYKEISRKRGDEWMDMDTMPVWFDSVEYRFKPDTVIINGIECPRPNIKVLDYGTTYYVARPDRIQRYAASIWINDDDDNYRLTTDQIYLSEEDIKTVLKAKGLIV